MRKRQYFFHILRAARLQKLFINGKKTGRNEAEKKTKEIVDRRGMGMNKDGASGMELSSREHTSMSTIGISEAIISEWNTKQTYRLMTL